MHYNRHIYANFWQTDTLLFFIDGTVVVGADGCLEKDLQLETFFNISKNHSAVHYALHIVAIIGYVYVAETAQIYLINEN